MTILLTIFCVLGVAGTITMTAAYINSQANVEFFKRRSDELLDRVTREQDKHIIHAIALIQEQLSLYRLTNGSVFMAYQQEQELLWWLSIAENRKLRYDIANRMITRLA